MTTKTPVGCTDLRIGHLSTLVFQGRQRQYADLDRLFGVGYDIVTVTEIGSDRAAFRRLAREHGYVAFTATGNDGGVAIKKTLLERDWRTGLVRVIRRTGREMGSTRPFGRKGITWAGAVLRRIGYVDVGTVHMLTGGRRPGRVSQHGKANHYRINQRFARVIGRWADKHGKGNRIAFVTGDTNIVDRIQDVFLGQAPNLITCWDEVGKWPNTGHGNIDVIARRKNDGRVECIHARAFTDKQRPFGSDHFLIEATYRIRHLKETR